MNGGIGGERKRGEEEIKKPSLFPVLFDFLKFSAKTISEKSKLESFT